MKLLLLLSVAVSSILAARIQLIDISPEEAQKYITEQSLDLKYAKLLGGMPLGFGRSNPEEGERKYYYNGKIIENPEDYQEEIYQASQFHGQDGLGRAMFGYTDHNQARLEARNANGDVRGSYQYVDPNGEDYKVQYWSDSLGFHQTDNRPKVLPVPVTDTPDVKAARLEHERAWIEAARLAGVEPDPMSDFYNRNANKFDDDQSENEQRDELIGAVSNQHQSLTRYPSLPYTNHISAAASNPSGVYAHDDSVYVEAGQETQNNERKVKPRYDGEAEEGADEVPSEPRGFFYSFDYPVSLIVPTEAKKLRDANEGRKVKRSSVEVAPAEAQQNKAIDSRLSLKAAEEGAIPIDAVHDAQVHPKQKEGLVNSQLLPVYKE